MTYNKPEIVVVANAIATIKGDKELVGSFDIRDSQNDLTPSAYQADE